MSFLSGRDRGECWSYFERHLAQIPGPGKAEAARRYLLEREENISLSTVGSYLTHIKAFGIFLGQRGWLDATRDDVIAHIKDARGNPGRTGRSRRQPPRALGQYTKYQRMVMLREFYKWLLEADESPPQFRRMPFTKPSMEQQSLAREERLTVDEVRQMLAATSDPMDRSIIMLLADSGFRASEVAALNIGDVTFDEAGARLLHSKDAVGLKTKRRKVPTRVTVAAPYLRDWIARHPRRLRSPPCPLYVTRSNRNFGQRIQATTVWSMVERVARRARIRHVHPHMFRHMAASMRAGDGWNEEMMRLHFGWKKGSEMPSLYSQVENDYDNFARRKAGLPVQEKRVAWTLPCNACHAECPGDAFFCPDCGQPVLDASREPTKPRDGGESEDGGIA